MKLHFHPASTTSRTVMLFCAEADIAYEPVIVDILTGKHYEEPFVTLNPSKQVPVLDDDGFILTESSTILKYLADKIDSPAYPKGLEERARVNERMDWFNTAYYREWGYHLVYPQTYPHHVREPELAQKVTIEWGKKQSEIWLGVLESHVLGDQKFLCGDEMTIADYFGAELISAGDLIGVKLTAYPKVDRWMKTMRALPSWAKTNEVADGFAASLKGKDFITIG